MKAFSQLIYAISIDPQESIARLLAIYRASMYNEISRLTFLIFMAAMGDTLALKYCREIPSVLVI